LENNFIQQEDLKVEFFQAMMLEYWMLIL